MCFILLGVSLYTDFEQRVFLSSLGPKTTIPIETNSNCGYRSISAGTAGLQDSHEDMRFDNSDVQFWKLKLLSLNFTIKI